MKRAADPIIWIVDTTAEHINDYEVGHFDEVAARLDGDTSSPPSLEASMAAVAEQREEETTLLLRTAGFAAQASEDGEARS